MKVSIIVPTCNEARNIGRLFEAIKKLPLPKEIIIVDDNSSDRTAELVSRFSTKYDYIKLIVRSQRFGIGSAYKDGMKLSSGDVIVEMDGDLSHNPEELPRIIEALKDADIVIGSRHVDGGRAIGWSWNRRLINMGANILARLVLGLEVKDATSGFRAYRRRVFEIIASMSRFNGFEFQVEATFIAQKLGFRLAEVPIVFVDRRRGESKLRLTDIANFARSIFKIRTWM